MIHTRSKLDSIQIYPVVYGVANTIYIVILTMPYNKTCREKSIPVIAWCPAYSNFS